MIPGPNGSRRYGRDDRRLCARPGCGSPAAATLRFLPTRREAWLVDLDDDAARTEGDLCARHAGALVLPRGWELHDERTRATASQIESRTPREQARARRRDPDASRARRDAGDRNDARPEIDTEVAGEKLADVLDAQTPLLRRAFQNVTPVDHEE